MAKRKRYWDAIAATFREQARQVDLAMSGKMECQRCHEIVDFEEGGICKFCQRLRNDHQRLEELARTIRAYSSVLEHE